MEKEFVPYAEALELKQIGFDEPCFGKFLTSLQSNWKDYELILELGMNDTFEDNRNIYLLEKACSAPTFSQAFRWFREKYNLHAEPYTANMGAIEYCFQIRDLYSEKYVYDNFVGAGASYSGTFNTPEEAELACLRKLIEIVKNK